MHPSTLVLWDIFILLEIGWLTPVFSLKKLWYIDKNGKKSILSFMIITLLWHCACIQHRLHWKLQNSRNRTLSIPQCILVGKHYGILNLFSNKIVLFIFFLRVLYVLFLLSKLKQKFHYFMTKCDCCFERSLEGVLISHVLLFKWRLCVIFCILLSFTFSVDLSILAQVGGICFKFCPIYSDVDKPLVCHDQARV